MQLNGHQIRDLTAILSGAFTQNELARVVQEELNAQLQNLVSINNDFTTVASDLINALNRQDRVIELLVAVRNVRSDNEAVCGFCDPIIGAAEIVIGAAYPLSVAIRKFNDRFQERVELFNFLNAYKELHDVLHELENFYPKIAAAVSERIANPSVPLAEDVAFFLEDHLTIARDNAQDIEFPHNPPAWIGRLEQAIQILKGLEFDKMPRQVERLKKLPADELRPLNDKLFENASRLEPEKLVGSLDGILAAIGTKNDALLVKLRNDVQSFRRSCSDLHELINTHNLCQKIDDALREAAGLPNVTAGDLSDWEIARTSLNELSLYRKDDRRVVRTNEAARLFEAASQGQAFATLIERFRDLFLETDKALLRVTNRLPREAIALHSALEHLQ
jgi:Effector-associated domain 1